MLTKFYLILMLVPLVSCGQDSKEFKLENSIPIKTKGMVCISGNECFSFINDSNLNHLIMLYSNEKFERKVVDTVEFSAYPSTIYNFVSNSNSSYVVLWETEYEYAPTILAYYISNGELLRIGELAIALPCEPCESFEYPINDIRICKRENEIEFSFLTDVSYRSGDMNKWKTYNAGTLKCSFNIETKKFKFNGTEEN